MLAWTFIRCALTPYPLSACIFNACSIRNIIYSFAYVYFVIVHKCHISSLRSIFKILVYSRTFFSIVNQGNILNVLNKKITYIIPNYFKKKALKRLNKIIKASFPIEIYKIFFLLSDTIKNY